MKIIEVIKMDARTFKVNIAEAIPISHLVTIDASYAETLTSGKASIEVLIEKSFEFLLEREPNTSILRSFDLSVIRSYFPEYERTIKSLLNPA